MKLNHPKISGLFATTTMKLFYPQITRLFTTTYPQNEIILPQNLRALDPMSVKFPLCQCIVGFFWYIKNFCMKPPKVQL